MAVHPPHQDAEAVPADLAFAKPDEPRRWFDNAGTVGLLVTALYGLVAVLVLLDLVVHKYSSFAIEHLFGFYAIAGVAGGAALVFAARILKGMLARPEGYYDR